MLKRTHRMTDTFEYNVSRKYGTPFKSRYFYLYAVKPTNFTGPTKIGVVTSTRLAKSAIIRNRVKRMYSEILRLKIAAEPRLCNNLWISIHPTHASIGTKYEVLSAEVDKALQKIPVTD